MEQFLKESIDAIIFLTLGAMGFVALWITIEETLVSACGSGV